MEPKINLPDIGDIIKQIEQLISDVNEAIRRIKRIEKKIGMR